MQDKNYYIKVHGHSCLEFRLQNTAIIFDPWLSGSAYWRSWWNFPEPTSVEMIVKEISTARGSPTYPSPIIDTLQLKIFGITIDYNFMLIYYKNFYTNQ
tara:strand:+ start:89 stop:385 length:297 start_codon:yes stop_codon:yes gene_type:complete